jgi:threonine dehydrogenase-like Zn-dependent dehydrogenase
MTGGRGANVVFDTSGMMFADAIEAAAHGGRIPVISASADGTASFNLRNLYRKELRVTGIDTRRLDVVACAHLLAAMAQYFKSGQFKVQPGQPHRLDEAVEAYTQVANGCKGLLRPN